MTSLSTTTRSKRLAFAADVTPATVYVCAIFYGGLIRLSKLPEVGFMPTDKLLHALSFGGLALLLVRAARALRQSSELSGRLWFGVCGSSFFGATLEICQYFVPYRSAEFLDWVADTVGAVLAVGLLALVLRAKRAHA